MPTAATPTSPASGDRRLLTVVKAVHTLIWFSVEAAVGYLLWAGATKRASRGVPVAATVVAAETLVFLGNGAACPLTGVAETLGADSGSVTDLYLPRPIAHNLPIIHVPVIGLLFYLHRDRIRRWLGRRQTA